MPHTGITGSKVSPSGAAFTMPRLVKRVSSARKKSLPWALQLGSLQPPAPPALSGNAPLSFCPQRSSASPQRLALQSWWSPYFLIEKSLFPEGKCLKESSNHTMTLKGQSSFKCSLAGLHQLSLSGVSGREREPGHYHRKLKLCQVQ